MKKLAILAALLVLPAVANAGLDLSWTDCAPTGPSDISLNCAQTGTAATTRNLILQFKVPEQFDQAAAFTAWMNLVNETDPGPAGAFWHFESVCTGQVSRGASAQDIIPATCADAGFVDMSDGDGSGGGESLVWLPDDPTPGRFRVIGTVARGAPIVLVPAQNYYLMHLAINNRNRQTTCESPNSCSEAIAIYWNKLLIESLDRPGVEIIGPSDKQSQCATIHGATAGACLATPVKNTTWGKLKSLYR